MGSNSGSRRWTATGKRPVFKIVTGVSSDALLAPFLFLAPDHDATLREFYTIRDSAGGSA